MKLREALELEKSKTMSKNEQMELRARNAVAQLMVRNLIVPNIFFDADWSGDRQVDLIAIDRAGSGDVHAVEIKSSASALSTRAAVRRLLNVHANYRWIGIVQGRTSRPIKLPSKLLSPYRGMGRVGVIWIEIGNDDQVRAEIERNAERFPGTYYEFADQFRSTHKPDIEFR
jgi:hypothetical protein